MMKKVLAALLGSAMIVSSLAGCGDSNADKQKVTESQSSKTSEDVSSESVATEEEKEFSYPMEGDHSISIWAWLQGNIGANFSGTAETEFAKLIEERTGISVTWEDSAMTDEDFNIMIAGDEYADVIKHDMSHYPGGATAALEDGVIVALNDVVEQYMPNLKALMEANPELAKACTNDDGVIWGFPNYSSKEASMYHGNYIRADLLEKIGKDVPTTIDEWYDVLTAFKNELGVEIPYGARSIDLINSSMFAYAYGVAETSSYKLGLDEDGNVEFLAISDAYKEFLQLLNKWYDEDLLDPDLFSTDANTVKANMSTGKAAATNSALASGMQAQQIAGKELDPDFEFVATVVPQVWEGVEPDDCQANWRAGVSFVVTSSCEDIEAVARFMDYFYSEEGIELVNFGTEGETYNLVDGKHVYTDLILHNSNGWTVGQALANYAGVSTAMVPTITHEDYYVQTLTEESVKEASALWSNLEEDPYKYKVPKVSLTNEESEIVAKYGTEIDTYMDEMAVKFILGTESFDNWDEYVATMEDLHYQDIVDAYQAAVERYNAR